jgi:hypothetical protein
MEEAVAIDQVIQRNFSQLQKPGVLFVRPGYKATNGRVKDEPAIVVTVTDKRKGVPARDRVPAKIGPYPTDVRQASPMHMLRASNPDLWAEVADAAPPAVQRPIFPFERDASGQLEEPILAAAAAKVAAKKPPKLHVPYTAPATPPLAPITDTFTIKCHASPDAGWTTLEPFLKATEQALTIAMYEFTAPHIVQGFLKNLTDKTLELVLDDPHDMTKREQTEVQTHDQLEGGFGKSLAFAWALEGSDPHVSGMTFPSAYHIKVIVRDSSAFWLSSGNLNSSNQPNIDPIGNLAGAKATLPHCDRDWHVIVEGSALAKLFEAFIRHDFNVASDHQRTGTEASDTKIVQAALAAHAKPPKVASKIPLKFFAPKSIKAKMKIEPVLTPDNFAASIIPLIRSAKKTFVMQTQYINPPKTDASLATPTGQSDAVLESLISAIKELIDEGVDVKLIMSEFETNDKIEALCERGINPKFIKTQAGVHNKGIIVDSSVVVVGSQNWSAEGVAQNRDASVIIHNAEAAKYWEQIFNHDWQNMADFASLD